MSWTYSLPIFGRAFKSYDYAKEIQKWNRDFERFTNRKVKYPLLAGKSVSGAYGDFWQSVWSGIGVSSVTGLALKGRKAGKSYNSMINYYERGY